MTVTGTQGMLPTGILYTKLWFPGAFNSCAYQLLFSWTLIAQNPEMLISHNLCQTQLNYFVSPQTSC